MFVIGAQADEECKKMHVKETCVSNVHTIEGPSQYDYRLSIYEIKKVKNCDEQSDICERPISLPV